MDNVKMVLNHEHYHRSKHYQAGATVQVTEAQAQFMESEGIGYRAKYTTTKSEVSDDETAS